MKITLENFRCYSHKTFEIPDRGLILLSGKNGKGKSTFIQAIIYAFFGECSVKPISHGAKVCTVNLEYDSIKIQRSTKGKPYKLSIIYNEKEYTDDTAQTVINKILGLNYHEFMAASYVAQRSKSSVITMTPSEQLKFVEKLSFTDDIRKEYQTKFKNKSKECQKQIAYTEGKISSLVEHYQKENERMPKKQIQKKDILNVDDLRSQEKHLKKEMDEIEHSLKKNQQELSSRRKEEERKSTIIEQKKILDIELQQLQKKKIEYGNILSEHELEELVKEQSVLHENIENMKKYSVYMQCLERATKHKNEYIENLESEIKSLKCLSDDRLKELESENEELLEKKKIYEEEREKVEKDRYFREHSSSIFEKTISDIKNTFSTLKTNKTHLMVTFLHKKNTSFQKELLKLEALFQKLNSRKICGETYECPKCKTNLYFAEDGTLSIMEQESSDKGDGDIDEQIKRVKKDIEQTKNLQSQTVEWIKTIKDISELLSKKPLEYTVLFDNEKFLRNRDQILEIKNKKEKHKNLNETLSILQTDDIMKYPPSIKSLFLEVEEKKKIFPKKFKPFFDLNEMKKKYEDLKEKISEERRKRSDTLTIDKEISNRQSKLKVIESSLSKNFLSSDENRIQILENEFGDLRKQSISISEKLSMLHETLSVALDQEKYHKDVERLEILSEEIYSAKEELKMYQRHLEGALGLLHSDKEAQILSLKTTLSKINSYSKFYLDKMFEDDDPMSVTLQSHKLSSTGDTIAKINTNIVYKGQIYNSFDEFCGGEGQKCELAFLFGVNDMLGSNMVFLDECINNLDSDSNMKTLYLLKKICGNKLIIVISHEAVLGIFDEVIYF
jgi:DNA repair protein SbcC/Rad50